MPTCMHFEPVHALREDANEPIIVNALRYRYMLSYEHPHNLSRPSHLSKEENFTDEMTSKIANVKRPLAILTTSAWMTNRYLIFVCACAGRNQRIG